MRKILLTILLIALVISSTILLKACATPPPMPTFEDIEPRGANDKPPTMDELMRGYELYINKCSGCHYLHQPSEFSNADWEKHLDKMQPKAKINYEEKRLILLYLERLNHKGL